MESRLLDACRDELVRQIGSRSQILDAAALDPYRCELLLERAGDGGGRARLAVDLSPTRPALYLSRPAAFPSGLEPFSRGLVGLWITGADRPGPGALLRLFLRSGRGDEIDFWLLLEWLGGRPDALLVDARSEIVMATLVGGKGPARSRREEGGRYHMPAPARRPPYSHATSEQVESLLGAPGGGGPARILARGFAGLPGYLAYEAVHRGGGEPARIAESLRTIASEPLRAKFYVIPDPPEGVSHSFVSPIPLASLADHEMRREEGLFRLMERAHEAMLRHEEEERIRAAWSRLLEREEGRLLRLRRELEGEIREAGAAPLLRRQAETILIHVREIPRGATSFRCDDLASPGGTIEVELDPKLSPAKNAEMLFRRAGRLDRALIPRQRRIERLDHAISRVSSLRDHGNVKALREKGIAWLREAIGPFRREGSFADWERIVAGGKRPAGDIPGRKRAPQARSNLGGRPASVTRADKRPEERFRPRSFKTREGWTVLVGRSNEENDYLTHRLAKPEDLWFHVHGAPGSHVVLRREGRKDNPSVRTIEEAAAIAAFYSKARTSRKAPVIYTLAKYVRKPRGGKPGLAVVTREKTILVPPKAPEDAGADRWADEE